MGVIRTEWLKPEEPRATRRGGAQKGAAGGVTGATVFFLLNGVFVPPERYEAFAKWEEAERSA